MAKTLKLFTWSFTPFCQVKQIPIYGKRWGFPIAVHTTDDIIQVWKTLLLLPPTKSMLILVGNIPASQL
jgi:hypothetical protein